MTKREQVTKPELTMRVFHENIYNGKEPMHVVGIREHELELEGDYSGGTQKVTQKDWLPLKGTFQVRKVCEQKAQPNGCQLHNIYCGYPTCEPLVDFEE